MNLQRTLHASCVLLVAMCGCLEPPPPPYPSPPATGLVLMVDGKEVLMPLELLSVFLDEDKNIPETFEMDGTFEDESKDRSIDDPPDVMLVGKFPLTLRIGYSEHWELLFGKPIKLLPYGGDWDRRRVSTLTLPGAKRPVHVTGGSITFEKIYYARIRSKTSPTISGKILIRIRQGKGEKEYSGTFAVRCMGWG